MQVHTGVCVIILVLDRRAIYNMVFVDLLPHLFYVHFLINASRGKTSFLTGSRSSNCDLKLRVHLLPTEESLFGRVVPS